MVRLAVIVRFAYINYCQKISQIPLGINQLSGHYTKLGNKNTSLEFKLTKNHYATKKTTSSECQIHEESRCQCSSLFIIPYSERDH